MRKPKTNKPATETASQETIHEQWARIGATLDLVDLNDHERAFLATCQRIHRRETGCNSPFEEFFDNLVVTVQWRWPSPDDVASYLEEFRQNFTDMKRDARQFMEAYPEKAAADA